MCISDQSASQSDATINPQAIAQTQTTVQAQATVQPQATTQVQASTQNSSNTQVASTPQTQQPARRIPSPLIVARILIMVLQNGLALALRQQRPHNVAGLNALRARLLQDPFFDPNHRPNELAHRTRPSRILFMDIIVLLAKLMRVLMRRGTLNEEALTERITVRNDCLDQPFFQRGRENAARPFVDDDEFEDEGIAMD